MRTHRVFPALQAWSWRAELVRELASGEHLVAARLEPVTRGREPTAFLDLHFSDGERSVTIPLVYVDIAQLDVREADPSAIHVVRLHIRRAIAPYLVQQLAYHYGYKWGVLRY